MTEQLGWDLPDQIALPGMPPAVAKPEPSGGVDAKRTRRQREQLARGIHPAMLGGLHPDAPRITEPGPRNSPFTCGACSHLYAKTRARTWLKCDQRGPGLDMRAWWPACRAFEPKETP